MMIRFDYETNDFYFVYRQNNCGISVWKKPREENALAFDWYRVPKWINKTHMDQMVFEDICIQWIEKHSPEYRRNPVLEPDTSVGPPEHEGESEFVVMTREDFYILVGLASVEKTGEATLSKLLERVHERNQ